MNDRARDIGVIKKKLILWRLKLVEELDNYEIIQQDDDFVNNIIQDNENIVCLIQKQKKINMIMDIDTALKKIEKNEYGICENSCEEIDIRRLAANPLAKYTLEIQQILEDCN